MKWTRKNKVMRFGYIMQLCATEVVLLDKLGKNKVSGCPTFYLNSNYRAASYFHSASKKEITGFELCEKTATFAFY
jgi:hypothetical protein